MIRTALLVILMSRLRTALFVIFDDKNCFIGNHDDHDNPVYMYGGERQK